MKKTRIAFNWMPILFYLCAAFMAMVARSFFSEGAIGEGILCVLFVLMFAGMTLVFCPVFYRFDGEGLTFVYLFFPNERYLWNKIREIEVDYASKGPTVFRIYADPEGKRRFYMKGEVYKTLRTNYLLKRYWDGTITGYFWEDVRNWFSKGRRKKEKPDRQYSTDEAVPMERQAREEARSALALYEAMATQMGLEIRTKYRYTDDEYVQTNSRPDSNYSYDVLIELSRPGETAEEQVVLISEELLHVRLGRSAYRGVKNEDAIPDLKLELDEMFKEIRLKGFDTFLREFNEE